MAQNCTRELHQQSGKPDTETIKKHLITSNMKKIQHYLRKCGESNVWVVNTPSNGPKRKVIRHTNRNQKGAVYAKMKS